MKTPEVDQSKINEAFYHLAMFLRSLIDAAGGNEHQPAAFKIKNAAKYIACSKNDLRRMRATGDLEPVETEWGLRWLKSDLDAYLEKCVAESEVEDESAELLETVGVECG